MIGELLISYVFDRLDKQIIRRIPYALLISLFIHLMTLIEPLLIPLAIISLVGFLLSTTLFNVLLNKAIENILLNIDFRETTKQLANIFEGRASLVDDIKAQENMKVITLAILGGTFLTTLLSTFFLMILNYFNIGKELVIPMIIVLFIYAYQDSAEADLLKEYPSKKAENSFMQDIAQTYLIDNSLTKLPTKSLKIVILKISSRIFGPLCHLTAPKIHSDILLVYNNRDAASFIKELAKENSSLKLRHEQGQSIENFFVSNLGNLQSITCLREKTPREVFPYFFDPNYSYQEKHGKWTALSIIVDNKVRGYLFIHMFKGVYLRRRIRKSQRKPVEQEPQQKEALLFIFIGERKYVIYLKTRIETLTIKYPQSLMDTEYSL